MVELKGSLNSLGLPAIVQLIGELHHSGNLELTRDGSRGVLGFEDGRLVAASFGDERGPKALAACARELVDADFLFVEGAPADGRTLALEGSELQQRLGQLMRGEVTAEALETPAEGDTLVSPGICPLLGFVDDRTRHYSRPTAMHRCFASGTPSLATSQEQRELCLSGRYSSCPRFRSASNSDGARPPLAAVPPPRAAAPPTPMTPPGMPARVASRMAAAGQMGIANHPAADTPPASLEPDQSGRSAGPKLNARLRQLDLGPRRTIVLVAIGALLGLLVLAAGVLLTRPTVNSGPAPKPVNTVAQPVAPQPTVAPATVVVTRPAAVPTSVPASTSTLAPRPATPTVRVVPTAAPVAPGQPLVDVRFASGPKPGWLDNPPYVTWSDGAYRFQARQPTRFVAVSAPIDRPLGDVTVSATFRKTGGPPGGGYGLVIRDQSPDRLDGVIQEASFYVVEAGDLGDIGIWRRDGDHWVDLVPWEHSASVRVGGSPNDLAVRAVGDRLTFMVNDAQVASVQDNTLVAGGVGVFVGGDYNEVAMDRFEVQVPD